MAFTFRSPHLRGHIDEAETILFDMLRLLALNAPLLEQLDRDFYESPAIPVDRVTALRDEALLALRAFNASWDTRPSAFERAVAQRPPAFHAMADEERLRPLDPERCLASLVAVCDDALAHGAGIECSSD